MKCKACGAGLDLTMASCPACGVELELGRLTGILGIVCRGCDAYNEPGAKRCAGCGKPLGGAAEPDASAGAEPALVGAGTTTPGAAGTPPEAVAPPAAAGTPPEAGASPAAAGTPPEAGASPAAAGTPPEVGAAPAAAGTPPEAGASPAAAGTSPEAGASPAAGAALPGTPVVRSFQKGGGPAATRFVPAAALRSRDETPAPLAARCPRCGADAGEGPFCATCGQAIGLRTQVMVSPVTPAARALVPGRATLVLERGDGDGATLRLDVESVEAGRSTGAVGFPDDPCLAPHHATFFYRDGALHVRDEGAPGGTFLKLRVLAVPLRPGDRFAVGERLLRFAGPLAPAPAQPPDGTRRLGAPRPPGVAIVLEECLEGGAGGRVFVRGGPSVTLGRTGCAVDLGDDPHLSQAHAELVVEAGGGARLRDLGSSSGTFVQLPPHGERELRDGDTVRIGREVLRVVVPDERTGTRSAAEGDPHPA